MEFNHYTLSNGIRCVHKQVKSAVVHCALTVNAGSRDELRNEYGLAHMLEHCFFKGTTHRKAYHINCRLENLGGEVNAYTTKEETVVHTTSLKGDFAKSVELIADIVFNSVFPQNEIDKEKVVIIDEINSYKDTPSEMIFDQFEEMLFDGSSLGHNILGKKQSINKFKRDELIGFVNRTYNTDQMVFSVIGNISQRRFEEVCLRYLGDKTSSKRDFIRDQPTTPLSGFEKSINRGGFQSHCIIGAEAYSLHDPKRIPLSLLINILGGPSSNSLLNLAVRERNALSYTIEAGYSSFTDTGIATIYFGTEKENLDRCIELIHIELNKIKSGRISPRLLSIAKKQFIGQMTISMESNEGYMLSAARGFMHHNTIESLENIHRKIAAITAAEITDAANEILNTSRLCTLIYK